MATGKFKRLQPELPPKEWWFRLRLMAEARGITLVELSNEVGVHLQTLKAYKKAKRIPSASLNLRLMMALGITWSLFTADRPAFIAVIKRMKLERI